MEIINYFNTWYMLFLDNEGSSWNSGGGGFGGRGGSRGGDNENIAIIL